MLSEKVLKSRDDLHLKKMKNEEIFKIRMWMGLTFSF